MSLYTIEKDYPVPLNPEWQETLSRMEKADSFAVALEENLFEIYAAAKELGIKITHREAKHYIRVWRVA